MSQAITKNMMIVDILDVNPMAAEILFEAGLACIGCAFSGHETLEQGCKGHGMTDEDIDEIVKELNSDNLEEKYGSD